MRVPFFLAFKAKWFLKAAFLTVVEKFLTKFLPRRLLGPISKSQGKLYRSIVLRSSALDGFGGRKLRELEANQFIIW